MGSKRQQEYFPEDAFGFELAGKRPLSKVDSDNIQSMSEDDKSNSDDSSQIGSDETISACDDSSSQGMSEYESRSEIDDDGEDKEGEEEIVEDGRSILDRLDLKSFYSICGRRHLSRDRSLDKSIFDIWHSYMGELVTRNPTLILYDVTNDDDAHIRLSRMHAVKDKLTTFYAWYLAGSPGQFLSNDFECWTARWNRDHPPSIILSNKLGPKEPLFVELYKDFHAFLIRAEHMKGLSAHVHLVILLHCIFQDLGGNADANLAEKLQINPKDIPLARILQMQPLDVVGDVWDIRSHFMRFPSVQIPAFFTFLAENAETVLGATIDKLALLEHQTKSLRPLR